jgi:hypothetical protein
MEKLNKLKIIIEIILYIVKIVDVLINVVKG